MVRWKKQGEGEKRKTLQGEKVGAADTLTDWLRSPNTRCCLQPRLARGPGQHNLPVLDNSSAWRLQLDTAPRQHNILLDISESHIFRFANCCLCVHDRERETDCGGPVSMATPARCSGSYAIQVIQPTMKSMHIRSLVFKCAACLPLCIHIQPLPGRWPLCTPRMSWPLPQCPAWVAGMIFPHGLIEYCI